MIDFKTLKNQAKGINKASCKKARLAVLGNYSTQFLSKSLEYSGLAAGINFDMYSAEYDQIDAEIYNPDSELYAFDPDFIFIAISTLKLQATFYSLSLGKKTSYSQDYIDHINELLTVVGSRCGAKIILNNLEIANDQVYGSLYAKMDQSFASKTYELNSSLIALSKKIDNCYLFDLNGLIQYYGAKNIRDWAQYVNSDMHYTLDFHALFAEKLTSFISAFLGNFKKCLILDLDNTLWGGIIGDDGLDGIEIGSLGIGKSFTEFQQWIKELKERGIVLAICSKNDPMVAKEPFENHPEMVLRLSDIAVFVANWENKADNIRAIQEVLNINLDSMVFIDDNPAERMIVRQNLPSVCVPELPEDPSLYLDFLKSLHLFEAGSFSNEDKERTLQYQQEANRQELKFTLTNIEDYLGSLDMHIDLQPFSSLDISRIAQLSQRSNQFNLRTVRYTENDIKSIIETEPAGTVSVKLRDKFGEYGLISAIILKKKDKDTLFIDTWIMSCRVLKRGVENAVLNYCVDICRKQGCTLLVGEYIPTPKNGLVKNHYKELGFEEKDSMWYLDVRNFEPRIHYIN
jgi:FkbH-like protein